MPLTNTTILESLSVHSPRVQSLTADLLPWIKMRRGIHIAIALVAIVLLAKPFDCFASGAWTKKAMECCKKGKCAPTANSDECCKSTSTERGQLTQSKAANQPTPLLAVVAVDIRILACPLAFKALGDAVSHPPPRIEFTASNLPLLI